MTLGAAWVQAVVVLWAELEQPVTETNRVIYVEGSELRAWLMGQPQRLSIEEVEALGCGIGA